MSRKLRILPALLLVAALAGCQRQAPLPAREAGQAATPARAEPTAVATPVTRQRGRLAFQPCTLSGAQALGNVQAQCAQLRVPERPDAPQGRRIPLKIAWLEARNEGAAEDPVFFIAGGPGQSATEVAPLVAIALGEVRKQRDIFLVDQRGTGGSAPLRCLDAAGRPLAEPDEAAQATPQRMAEYAARCAAGLKDRADTRWYTTAEAVGDLDAVRDALGVARIDLVGVSYGTRVAQRYAQRYPQHLRALVLDGVAPNDLVVGAEFASTFEDAIALQTRQCRQDPACARRFPADTRAQLRTLMDRLRQAPVDVDYREPGTGEIAHGRLTADTVLSLAFAFSYAPQTASLLPLVLDEAAQGRYEPLMSLAQLAGRQMEGQVNRPMQWSVICAEDAGRYRPASASGTLLGPEVAQMFFAACPAWASGQAPAAADAPLRSPVPALLLSGELDPVTPPRYAERVLAGLPNGRHWVAPGQGHSVMALGCIPKLLGQFLESADARALDGRCVDQLNRVPAFTSFNGWEP